MRIDRIRLENFRAFAHLELDLHPEFNVLIGKNGAGKTTLLDALAVAAGSWLLGIRSGGGKPRLIYPRDARLVGRQINDKHPFKGDKFEPQYPVLVEFLGMIDNELVYCRHKLLNEQGDMSIHGGKSHGMDGFHPRTVASEADEQVRNGQSVTLPFIAYYGCDRLHREDTQAKDGEPFAKRETSRFEGYRDALSAGTRGDDLTRWLEYQDRVAYEEGERSPEYQAVLDAMRDLLPGATDVRYSPRRTEAVVAFEDGNIQPFSNLSDGQRNMAALGGDIAMRAARLNPQFGTDAARQTPGIVLIDELDLHLHPEWQREIVARLRRTFPLIQFVATTHSPQIIGELRPENIIELEADGPQQPFQTYGMDSNFVLRHVMNTSDRDPKVGQVLREIEDLLDVEDYDGAQQQIDELRADVGEFADLVRLQARLNKVLLLSR